jgi:hypothetical protein
MRKLTYIITIVFTLTVLATQAQTVNVTNSLDLQTAINAATAGQTIVLADGVYIRSGGFYVNAGINGTATQPITIKGNGNTIISSNNLSTGYGFALKGNSYWVLDGFTVYNSKKGIVIDNSHHNDIKNIKVNKIGDEGIHLRTYSSYNTVESCFVDSTGLVSTGTGEGIYVGSANSNWATYTSGNPDTCNYNVLTGNSFGDHIVSENMDIKEGTKGGTITYNVFNGAGLNGQNYADSWLDMKGNNYTVSCNTGSNTIADGFQTHINYASCGDYNTFSNNNLTVGSTGYAINVSTSSSNGTATHNVVCSNNTVSAGAVGLTNVATQTCTGNCLVTAVISSTADENGYTVSPNPASNFIELKLPVNTVTSYVITDALGKVKKSGSISSGVAIVNIQELSSGVYFVIFSETTRGIRFIKQ